MDKKSRTGIIVFVVVIALAVLVGGTQFLQGSRNPVVVETTGIQNGQNLLSLLKNENSGYTRKFKHDYIAKVCITGTIQEANKEYNQQWLLETIDNLEEDSRNVGMILYIDSPGGTVYEADEVYLRLLAYAEEKPLYAYFGPLAASGGYYIGCAAGYIGANRNTLTGSIGVLAGQFVDLTGLMEKWGVKSETIHAGRNKNMGSYNEPVTEEQRAIMQSVADECYEQFTEIVSSSRGIGLEKVRELADGRIYTAKQAKALNLIDCVCSWDEFVELFEENELDSDSCSVEEFSYEYKMTLRDYLRAGVNYGGNGISSAQSLPQAVEEVIAPSVDYPAYLYR